MKRSATANWKGGLKAGKGTLTAASGDVFERAVRLRPDGSRPATAAAPRS